MKIHEYNQMMKYLTRPAEGGVIGGGMIEGEDLGSRTGFAEPLPTNIQNWLKETLPDVELDFSLGKYGLPRNEDKALYTKVQTLADKKLKDKNYVYTPAGTDFESLEYKKGYGTGKQLIAKAKEKGIYVSDSTLASIFADNFKIPSEQNPKKGGRDKIYDLSVLDDDAFVEKIQRAQVSAGRATPEATEKFLSTDIKKVKKRKKQLKRDIAEKSKGGVKTAFTGTAGVEKGHMNDLFSQYITGQNLGYVPKDINKEIGKKGGIDDKMRSLYKKRERLLKQKPKNLKKELENINAKGARLAGQSQGFKTFTIMDPVSQKTYEFGGKRFQLDPTNQFPGKTESEIVDFIKNADPNDFDAQLKIKMFEDNRQAVFDAVKKQQKPLTKSFIEKQKADKGRLPAANKLYSGFSPELGKLSYEVLKDVVKGIPTPLGAIGLNVGLGVDPKETIDRVGIEAELALAPELVKQSARFGPTAQRILNLGLKAAPALRVARALSPLGLLSLAGEAGYYTYKKAQETQAAIDAMTPHQRELYESQMAGEALMGEAEFADGGRVGFEKGGSSSDKKKTPLDKPTVQIDPNAPVDPAKRDTLKGAGILGAGVALGKLGLLRFAPKIKKTITETTEAAETAPAIVEELYNMIKLKGLGKTTYPPIPERSVETGELLTQKSKQLGNYELTEHPSGGFTIKQVIDTDYRYQVNEFTVYKDKDGKFVYEEISAKPDREGKLKDVDYGVDMDTYREIGEDLQRMTKDDQYIKIANESIDQALEDTGMVIDKGILKRNK